MAYKALYLKYRPQSFEEVAGQKPIVRTLKNALSIGKIAHAYLFAGPRGTGKTSLARLFAKALNCEEGLGHQCGHCSNCLSIAEGTHPDVIEVDAASNNGVDQVRELIEGVRYSPLKGRYKVYIIDEVHMMSTGAFNALLKTIEEPPENVIFILCTTEPFKVLPTILSRCQRFDFSKLSETEMGDKLREILSKENVTYEENGLKEIIALADGGMRDALSILDQVLAYSGNALTEKDVLSVYGLASKEEKISLLKSLREGDVAKVITQSDLYISKGLDIRRFLYDLIALLKDLLVYEKTGREDLLDNLKASEAETLMPYYPSSVVNDIIKTLLETQNNFKAVSDIRSLFELTLLELASKDDASKSGEIEISKKREIAAKPVQKPVLNKNEEILPHYQSPSAQENPSPNKEMKETISDPLQKEVPSTEEKPTPKPLPLPKSESTEKVPDWLWDDKKEEKPLEEEKPLPPKTAKPKEEKPEASSIDTSKILKPQIATEGERFTISEDEILKIMVLADKNERKELLEKWTRLEPLKLDPRVGALASLLSSGAPYCLSKEALILVYKHRSLAEKANIVANQLPLEGLLETMLGRKVFIYSLDNNEKLYVQNRYYSLMQVNQLPDKKTVTLNIPKIQ